MELKIDPEFRDLLRPLTIEEREELLQSILTLGCRDPIDVWKGTDIIVDGMNRYEICQDNAIPFKVRYLKFEDREQVIAWMIANQLARRNLTPEERTYLISKRYGAAKKAKGAPEGNRNASKKQMDQNEPIVSTAEKVALELNVSPATVKRAEQFADAVDAIAKTAPALKEAALSGRIDKTDVPKLAEIPDDALQALAALPGDQQRKAAKAIVGGAKPKVAKAEAQKIVDGTGKPVPKDLEDVFATTKGFDDAMNHCTQIKKAVNALIEGPAGRCLCEKAVDKQILKDLQNVRSAIAFAKPYAVCPYCKGKGCQACGDSGWVPERVFKSAPSEKKR